MSSRGPRGASLDPAPSRGAALTLSPGTRLGPYEIQAAVGVGGMGEVYKAKDTRLERSVAIKVLSAHLSADPERRARFAREARAIAGLNHRHICALHDVGREGDVDFLVMEYVDGTRLASTYPVAKALEYAIQIVDALRASHQNGVIHRDLKPANVMVTPEGQVKVLDFGLAKHLAAPAAPEAATVSAPSDEASLTRHGVAVGTVPYMSPEQVEGKPLDARSDIFSFGSVLYELLTGQRAFQGDSAISTMSAILHETPVRARKVRHEVPRSLEAILNRCLEKSRDARYASAADLHEELVACEAKLLGRSTGFQALLQPRVGVPLLLVLVVAIVAAAWFGVRGHRARWARNVALPEIARLGQAGPSVQAFRLASEARRFLPEDRGLQQLWRDVTAPVTIRTTPPGAAVEWRDYSASDDDPWESLGPSPIAGIRVPNAYLRWRISKEGFDAYLFLPRNAVPPYQTVVHYPGGYAFRSRSSENLSTQFVEFLLRSGHAVLYPIYKGSYERGGGLPLAGPSAWRDQTVQQSRDLGRSIDYLETRPDIDRDRLAFYGLSAGAINGPILTALEPRFKASILASGGFPTQSLPPEADPINFAPRAKMPVLMLNGLHDFLLPLEGAQKPMFRLLGAPQKDKRHVVFENSGHFPNPDQMPELIKEALDWLDRYLGPVRTK